MYLAKEAFNSGYWMFTNQDEIFTPEGYKHLSFPGGKPKTKKRRYKRRKKSRRRYYKKNKRRSRKNKAGVLTFTHLKELKKLKTKANDLPAWNYDGSSTEQALGEDSEVYIIPRKIYKDPFRPGDNYLVMCDTWLPDLVTPHPTNSRHKYAQVYEQIKDKDPWFGFEMEFFMLDKATHKPLGFPESGKIPVQGS